MSKITCPIFKIDDRIVFKTEDKYVLLDTGMPSSISADGNIGPFKVTRQNMEFFDDFINLEIPDGSKVTAILSPNDGYNCHLRSSGLIITDEEEELPQHDYFLPFIGEPLPFIGLKTPIVRGTLNGNDIRLFFDSGARMTMFGEMKMTGGKPSTGSYREWLAMLHKYEDLSVYEVTLDFPCGLHYEGKGALVNAREYIMCGMMMGFSAMLGIDIFDTYDIYISTANEQRGIALSRR